MAGALRAAHRLDILHRDVKPANILITDFGEPALSDFGIAHLTGAFETAAGTFTGSPAYNLPLDTQLVTVWRSTLVGSSQLSLAFHMSQTLKTDGRQGAVCAAMLAQASNVGVVVGFPQRLAWPTEELDHDPEFEPWCLRPARQRPITSTDTVRDSSGPTTLAGNSTTQINRWRSCAHGRDTKCHGALSSADTQVADRHHAAPMVAS